MKNRLRNEFHDRKNDRALSASIRRRLDHEGHGRLRRIRCDVHQGLAVLWGSAASDSDRQMAVEIVRRYPKVDGVINRIQLRCSGDIAQPAA